jgi:hypothetical protein
MWRTLIFIGFLSAIARPAVVDASCLEYGIVNLSGTLVRQTYPGPPDYESVTRGDEPQIIWILQLDRRICVVDSDSGYSRDYGEREIQLVLRGDQYAHYGHLLGKRIMATGKLLPGGGRYETQLVLAANEIRRARVRP